VDEHCHEKELVLLDWLMLIVNETVFHAFYQFPDDDFAVIVFTRTSRERNYTG